jgi:hypothetical protein
MRIAGIVAACLILGLPPVAAQSTATVTVDTTHLTVGDRVTMTISVEHPPGTTVAWPDSLDLAPFEVLDVGIQAPLSQGDVLRSSAVLTLTAFELGMLEIPSIDVVVSGGVEEEVVSTDPFAVEVASVGADESGDIRDIRGPLGIPLSPLRMALLMLLPLLLAALLFVVARRLRSRKKDVQRPALGPLARPPHEVALEALSALEASRLLERGQVKEFHIEASDILRRYVEARFHVAALEMTTFEVLAGLEAARSDARFRDGLSAFLQQCDLVKFAKVRPPLDASSQLIDLGRRIVLDSVPTPTPAPDPATTTQAA